MFNYTPPRNLLNNKIILVTGAGDGIGRVAAKTYAAHGAKVILLGRTIKKLESIYDEINKAEYPRPAIYPMDLEGATPNDYDDLAETLSKEFGRLDGLLHNAGILGTLTPIEHYDIKQWYKIMQINLNAPFMLTKACIGLLKAAPDASVVFTSSSVGRKAKAYWGSYAVSKFGIEGLMQILADELETNTKIRVNSINPGATRTSMRATAYPGEDIKTVTPPQAIMPLYLYLMGSDSSEVKGQTMDAQKSYSSKESDFSMI